MMRRIPAYKELEEVLSEQWEELWELQDRIDLGVSEDRKGIMA